MRAITTRSRSATSGPPYGPAHRHSRTRSTLTAYAGAIRARTLRVAVLHGPTGPGTFCGTFSSTPVRTVCTCLLSRESARRCGVRGLGGRPGARFGDGVGRTQDGLPVGTEAVGWGGGGHVWTRHVLIRARGT